LGKKSWEVAKPKRRTAPKQEEEVVDTLEKEAGTKKRRVHVKNEGKRVHVEFKMTTVNGQAVLKLIDGNPGDATAAHKHVFLKKASKKAEKLHLSQVAEKKKLGQQMKQLNKLEQELAKERNLIEQLQQALHSDDKAAKQQEEAELAAAKQKEEAKLAAAKQKEEAELAAATPVLSALMKEKKKHAAEEMDNTLTMLIGILGREPEEGAGLGYTRKG
jgi:hypothetical protein